MRLLVSLFLIFALFCASNGAKILITSAHDSSSHINSIKPFFVRLAEEGHDVTVLDTSNSDKPKMFGPKVKVVHIGISPDQVAALVGENFLEKMGHRQWKMDTNTLFFMIYMPIMDKVLGLFMDHHAETLYSVTNASWDLVVSDELFGVHQFALNSVLKRDKGTPYIVFATSTMLMSNYVANSFGRPGLVRPGMFPPLPANGQDVFDPTNFYLRIHGFTQDAVEYISFRYVVENFLLKNLKRFGATEFSWAKYMKDSSMILTDHFDRFQFPMPEGNDFHGVGSHCPEPKTLEGEFLDFVEDPTSKGTIYVAFGSFVRWEYAPDHVLNAFVDGFNELSDYRIIFSYNGNKELKLKHHVKVISWAPQQEILSHNKTKMFVSHGGLKSMKEALCTFTPVVYMPLFAEQAHNARIALEMGIGGAVNKYTVSKETLLSEMRHVLDESDAYTQKVRILHSIYMDRIIPSLDEAVFYAERVLRKKGHPILFKRAGIDLGWVEHLHLDLAALLLGTLWLLTKD
ncbi:hypothetical protein L596_015435 [Steinernema carpocapsae]|uniref:glucuronosyltransferase n=1 Tax=Steinernema carpocapsae TaxID=34508 RepID=A0A4U5NEZ5_STECR|nr:hypothetical protein L596_015435 [Steinernema carpocapsae]